MMETVSINDLAQNPKSFHKLRWILPRSMALIQWLRAHRTAQLPTWFTLAPRVSKLDAASSIQEEASNLMDRGSAGWLTAQQITNSESAPRKLSWTSSTTTSSTNSRIAMPSCLRYAAILVSTPIMAMMASLRKPSTTWIRGICQQLLSLDRDAKSIRLFPTILQRALKLQLNSESRISSPCRDPPISLSRHNTQTLFILKARKTLRIWNDSKPTKGSFRSNIKVFKTATSMVIISTNLLISAMK